MSSRDSHLSIDTAHANAAAHNRHSNQQALPSPMSSTSRSSSSSLSSQSLPCPPPEGMISTATLSHPPTLAIPSVPYPPPTHSNNGYLNQQQHTQQRQRSLSGSGPAGGSVPPSWGAPTRAHSPEEEEHMARLALANMNRRPSLPANHPYHHPMERLPSHDPRRQQQILQQQQQSQQSYFRQQHGNNSMGGRSSASSQQPPAGAVPLTPNTPTSSSSSSSSGPAPPSLTSSNSNSNSNSSNGAGAPPPQVVRHPLWRLDCQSCKTTLCEQAMQGHLVGDPSKKLFSTNLAIG
ncbi:hypothetical protein EMPS_04918 [Entomortierella parvispora]|uniref:Uncharacterized protein n=1 Tax=Entomortierella parvispora TaxID=205924 RepID=A0A9P3H9Q7_9FUNG|nr:hypothetical protein EMPS_04918 [Entomortierella parvispora]